MPFFFIVPVWAVCVVIGVVLLFVRNLRRIAYFIIAVPTGATLASFALSTLALYLGPRVAHESHQHWFGVVLIAGYLIALVLGAFLGGIGAFLLLLKLPATKRA